eukprot:c29913_g1_i1 orf=43-228(+)
MLMNKGILHCFLGHTIIYIPNVILSKYFVPQKRLALEIVIVRTCDRLPKFSEYKGSLGYIR